MQTLHLYGIKLRRDNLVEVAVATYAHSCLENKQSGKTEGWIYQGLQEVPLGIVNSICGMQTKSAS